MRSTAILRHEHDVILQALAILEVLGSRAAAGAAPPEADVAGLLEFFTTFADGCHHAKEETILFPALEAAGLPKAGGPLGAMLDQHAQGRRLVAALRSAAPALGRDGTARERFAAAARDYVALLEQHITIENQVLFPRADAMLGEEQDREMAAAFDAHEERLGAELHQRFHRMLNDMAGRYRG